VENVLSESDSSLLWSHDGTSNEEEVLLDNSIVGESSEGSDILLGHVILAVSIVEGSVNLARSNSVDLVIELSSVEVSILTSSGAGPLD
jgi:hypothetical protein